MRWSIEVCFKECKQYLHLKGSQSQYFYSQIAHVSICLMQCSLLSLMKQGTSYETLGDLFLDTNADVLEVTLYERILFALKDFLEEFEKAVGRDVIGNYAASGTEIIKELGEEQLASGSLIVYTSADSVFQIAANEEIIPLEELYRDCEIARKMLTGVLEVGRVIARPFVGETSEEFRRTGARRDFSAEPPTTMCDLIAASGRTVYAIGKIEDIFAHKGITKSNHAAGNPACIEAALSAQAEDYEGLLFVNLVDTDMIYGHRRDVQGYADALAAFDAALPKFVEQLGPEDLLIITADHGCDPTFKGTDHTREYIPLLVYGKFLPGNVNLHTRETFADISATVLDWFGIPNTIYGTSFLREIQGKTER